MKLQKILSKFQKLHSREIDLSLDRIRLLMSKLGNPEDKIKCIQVCGTNGKGSTISFLRSILKEANYKCNVYTSPHVISINERFVYNDEIIRDDDLANLLNEVHEVNNGKPLTYFEALTAAFFLGCMNYQDNIVLAEFGLFGRGDAVNILKKNLANIAVSMSMDHESWLPENDRTIERIIYEKTSSLLNSNIIVAKQSSKKITECIKKNISNNSANKIFHGEDYNFVLKENGFFFYEDQYGSLKVPKPYIKGDFQLENASTAIATLRTLKDLNIKDQHIIEGVKKAHNPARLEEIKEGKLKNLVKNNTLICDGTHNPGGAEVLSKYLYNLNCDVHAVIGMMHDKNHEKFIGYFKNLKSVTTVDIPNTPNAIDGKKLKEKFNVIYNVQYKESIEDALKSIPLNKNDVVIITGSLYLASEVLKIN